MIKSMLFWYITMLAIVSEVESIKKRYYCTRPLTLTLGTWLNIFHATNQPNKTKIPRKMLYFLKLLLYIIIQLFLLAKVEFFFLTTDYILWFSTHHIEVWYQKLLKQLSILKLKNFGVELSNLIFIITKNL